MIDIKLENFEREWADAEKLLADEETDASDRNLLQSKVVFGEDGIIRMVMPIPEGVSQKEIDESIASGELKLFGDNMMQYEEHSWKTEDGKVYFNTGIKGEILGEEINPWDEIKEEDGYLRFFTYHLVKE